MARRMRDEVNAPAASEVRVAPVARRDARRARNAGSADGRRGIPQAPIFLAEQDQPPPATSPFLVEAGHGVRQLCQDRLHKLAAGNADLVAEIYLRSRVLVQFNDELEQHQSSHMWRLMDSLGKWAALVNGERLYLQAEAAYQNRVIELYWAAVLRRHPVVRHRTRSQGQYSEQWTGDVPGGWPIQRRAAEAVPMVDLTRWQPARVDEKLAHITPVDTLREVAHVGVVADPYEFGALARALDIINRLSPTGAA